MSSNALKHVFAFGFLITDCKELVSGCIDALRLTYEA